jgi:hypothetical protein
MLPCPYCSILCPSDNSIRGHIRRHHATESRANSTKTTNGDATDDSLEYCEMCKLHVLKNKITTPSGLQRAHDFSTCHMQNLARRVSQQRSSSAQRSGEAHSDDDPDDHDGNSNAGGYEDDGFSHGTSGESEEAELRNVDSRYGDVLERLNDASERNGHDWLGRNDFVVDGEYPIGEVFLLPLTTPL